jgi:SAM-dependent methyltransferase
MEEMGVVSTMSTARHWYYARRLDELAAPGALDVLEIGAGAGNLAIFLARRGRVGSYTIIDLPEMLLASATTVVEHLAGASIGFGADATAQFRFLGPSESDLLEPGSFDLCCNFNSFMEMDREQRDTYIDLIYRCARPGALFANVNRRQPRLQLRDGSTWDNNPLLYPYRPDDVVLEWEDDPFHGFTRAKFLSRPSLAFFRAARIATAPAEPLQDQDPR